MKRILAILLFAALICSPVLAGVVYEIEVTDHEQSPPKSESIQAAIEGRHLKMGIASKGKGAQGEMIFRGDRKEMVVIDHENMSYHFFDEEMMKGIAVQLGDANRMMQDALKNVPEDKRAMVEQMMKQRMPSSSAPPPQERESELRKTSERASHSGYPCVKYEVVRDGRTTRELWVTPWSNIEGGTEVAEAFEEMADFIREMFDSLPTMGGARAPVDENVFEHMRGLGGFPVVTREFGDDGSLEGETTLRSSKRQTIDPDAFEPPAGYKRQEMVPGR